MQHSSIRLATVALSLGLAVSLPVGAQQSGQGSSGQNSSAGQSTQSENRQDRDWGWLGLLGLAGLAGLMRKREEHVIGSARRT